MHILVNFDHRDHWSVHCLAADCKTLVRPWFTVRTDITLLRLLKASGATQVQLDEVERDMARGAGGARSSK
jgi:hypothetical protein